MELLLRLQRWYAEQCNGDWEHQYGVRIDTLDNPGWMVKIDVVGTALEDRPFVTVAEGVEAASHPKQPRWVHCVVRDGVCQGAGDETQLGRLLAVFLDWSCQRAEPDSATDCPRQ